MNTILKSKRLRKVILSFTLFIALLFPLIYFFPTQGGKEERTPAGKAKWLTIHYVCMDNNLDAIGEWKADLNSLEEVGSTPLSKHIVLYDGEGENNTVIQYVLSGGVKEISINHINSSWGDEVNMGDPNVLSQFILWAEENYPSERICLVLNDHGGGWRGICWDDTSNDFLSGEEVGEALKSVVDLTGKKIDVLLTYACIMATVEFFYDIYPYVDYFVGSQTFSWGSETHGKDDYLIGNYPFDKIFSTLKEKTDINGKDFALEILKDFQPYGPWKEPDMYVYRDYTSDAVSVVNMSLIPSIVDAINALSVQLLDSLKGIKGDTNRRIIINRVIGSPQSLPELNTQSFSGQLDWLGLATFTNYDLLDFIHQLKKLVLHPLATAAVLDQVEDSVTQAVIMCRHGYDFREGDHVDAHGISIWMPIRAEEYKNSYETIKFSEDTHWDEFLKALTS